MDFRDYNPALWDCIKMLLKPTKMQITEYVCKCQQKCCSTRFVMESVPCQISGVGTIYCRWFDFRKVVYHKWDTVDSIRLADEAGMKWARKMMIKAVKQCGCAVLDICLDSPSEDDDPDLNDPTPFHDAILDAVLKEGWDKILDDAELDDLQVLNEAIIESFTERCSTTCKEKAAK